MSLLLDTNALIWWLADKRLTEEVLHQIAFEPRVMISVVSPWEIWIKAQQGRLMIPTGFDEALTGEDALTVISPTLDDVRLAAALPMIHRDPFDRMIVAQAFNRQATVVTGDRQLARYGVDVLIV